MTDDDFALAEASFATEVERFKEICNEYEYDDEDAKSRIDDIIYNTFNTE